MTIVLSLESTQLIIIVEECKNLIEDTYYENEWGLIKIVNKITLLSSMKYAWAMVVWQGWRYIAKPNQSRGWKVTNSISNLSKF